MLMIHWTVIIVQGTAKGKRNKVVLTFHLPVRYPLLLATKTTSRSDQGRAQKNKFVVRLLPLTVEKRRLLPLWVCVETNSIGSKSTRPQRYSIPVWLVSCPPRWGGCREIDLLILIMISVGEEKKSKMMELACGVLHIDQAAALCWVLFF